MPPAAADDDIAAPGAFDRTASAAAVAARPPVWPRYALPAFLLAGALDLVAEAAGPRWAFDVTKPLLMPLLLGALLATGRAVPRPLLGALLASCLGDTMLLLSGDAFLVGMGGFLVAHLCYIRFFLRAGAPRRRGRLLPAVAFYGTLWAVLVSRLWSGLPANLRGPVAGYSLVLVGMVSLAFAASTRTGIGGALFLSSDTMIAGGLAHWHMPTATGVYIMATYLVAQYLLATGCLRLAERVRAEGRARMRPAAAM